MVIPYTSWVSGDHEDVVLYLGGGRAAVGGGDVDEVGVEGWGGEIWWEGEE